MIADDYAKKPETITTMGDYFWTVRFFVGKFFLATHVALAGLTCTLFFVPIFGPEMLPVKKCFFISFFSTVLYYGEYIIVVGIADDGISRFPNWLALILTLISYGSYSLWIPIEFNQEIRKHSNYPFLNYIWMSFVFVIEVVRKLGYYYNTPASVMGVTLLFGTTILIASYVLRRQLIKLSFCPNGKEEEQDDTQVRVYLLPS